MLVVGGYNTNFVFTSEIFDPAVGAWAPATSPTVARQYHTATTLSSGKVLVAGGYGAEAFGFTLSSAELYDPATGRWDPTAYLNSARWFHTATLLPNGKILVAGGTDSDLNSAELYDPNSSPNLNFIDDARFF